MRNGAAASGCLLEKSGKMKRGGISSRFATRVKKAPIGRSADFPPAQSVRKENGMALPLRPSDPGLLYCGTADDQRLGERVRHGAPSVGVALIGYADDRAVVNGRGRAGAAAGPAEVRRFLYRLTPGDRGELE